MSVKKWICVLLAVALAVSVLPSGAMAVTTGSVALEMVEFQEDFLFLQDAATAVDGGPSLAAGKHVRYIDRIAALPDYASVFYDWLLDNATSAGALADPAKGTYISNMYGYLMTTFTGTARFTYNNSQDKSYLAKQAALAALGNQPQAAMQYASAVFSAFDADHPEIFWLAGGTLCGYGLQYEYSAYGGVGSVTYSCPIYFFLSSSDFDVRAEKYRSSATIADGITLRDRTVAEILQSCPRSGDYDQLRYFNEVLTKGNCYNSAVASGNSTAASSDAWECISALEGRVGTEGPVCEGYARAFKVLCDAADIPCVLVSGDAKSTVNGTAGGHMWNYVLLEDSWYAVDPTWNDPTVSGVQSPVSGYESERWFLLGGSTEVSPGLTFLQSHPVENRMTQNGLQFTNGPTLSDTDYALPSNLMDISDYRSGSFTAPQRDGYVFGGWYTDPEMTEPITDAVVQGHAYAKFVDAQVLSVRWQLSDGTDADSASTQLRLLTSVDSLDYQRVGLRITINGSTAELSTDSVYEMIADGDRWLRDSKAVFGPAANYFMCRNVTNVPGEVFHSDITVTPFWVTPDGTEVVGEGRTFRISDVF